MSHAQSPNRKSHKDLDVIFISIVISTMFS